MKRSDKSERNARRPTLVAAAHKTGYVVVVDSGFSTFQGEFEDGVSLNWALILENPNSDSLATGVPVNVSFVDASGSVVATASDTVGLLLPGTRAAVTGGDFITFSFLSFRARVNAFSYSPESWRCPERTWQLRRSWVLRAGTRLDP
ncbi:MAG: hypothetical protein ABIO99_09555 [Candidatus Limnocylindria bacterium]